VLVDELGGGLNVLVLTERGSSLGHEGDSSAGRQGVRRMLSRCSPR
jgi:hypothetical protein